MGLARKKIIPEIPKFSSPSLAWGVHKKKTVKTANSPRCVKGLSWSRCIYLFALSTDYVKFILNGLSVIDCLIDWLFE